MEKWLDIIITGDACPGFDKIMGKLMADYDVVQVYEIGAPHQGINPQVTGWAFQNCHPLILALPEDTDAILRRFDTAEHKAVLMFNDGTAKGRKEADAAKLLAEISNAQYREIPVGG